MKQRIIALRHRYVKGLRSYLRKASRAHAQEGLSLGRQAVALGLENLELAQIHQWAIDALKVSTGKRELITQAERFFAEATTPIVMLHSEASRNARELSRLKKTLRERTSALKLAHHSLQRNVARRQTTEAALKANGKHYNSLLKESHLVRDSLQHLTRKVLRAQEQQRSEISHELQDDIAQTLLGINVRLLLLRTKAGSGSQGISDELASTQRVVAASRRSVRNVTRRIGTT
jgi:two-component system, NarL family, sensor histidine kinase DegS